jgi:hypothetical protein
MSPAENGQGRHQLAERWKPTAGRIYRIGDRLLRLLYVRRGEPIFEIELAPLPIDSPEKPRPEPRSDEGAPKPA